MNIRYASVIRLLSLIGVWFGGEIKEQRPSKRVFKSDWTTVQNLGTLSTLVWRPDTLV